MALKLLPGHNFSARIVKRFIRFLWPWWLIKVWKCSWNNAYQKVMNVNTSASLVLLLK